MSVGQNIEFPLKLKKMAPNDRKQKSLELLDLLRLPKSFYEKRISQCSGGEKQRVALARALAFDPEILFFDEPLSALDYRLRKTLEKELKNLHLRTGKTFVYITHSLEEAMVMSDRIAIMRDGEFEQISVSDDIYERPVSRFVAEFMGEVNLFEVSGTKKLGLKSASPNFQIKCDPSKAKLSLADGTGGILVVRPECLRFLTGSESADFVLTGKLKAEYALGSRTQYEIETASQNIITVEKLREDRFMGKEGSKVTLGFDAESAHIIEEL